MRVFREEISRNGVAFGKMLHSERRGLGSFFLNRKTGHQTQRAALQVLGRFQPSDGRGGDDLHLILRYVLFVEDYSTAGSVVAYGHVE